MVNLVKKGFELAAAAAQVPARQRGIAPVENSLSKCQTVTQALLHPMDTFYTCKSAVTEPTARALVKTGGFIYRTVTGTPFTEHSCMPMAQASTNKCIDIVVDSISKTQTASVLKDSVQKIATELTAGTMIETACSWISWGAQRAGVTLTPEEAAKAALRSFSGPLTRQVFLPLFQKAQGETAVYATKFALDLGVNSVCLAGVLSAIEHLDKVKPAIELADTTVNYAYYGAWGATYGPTAIKVVSFGREACLARSFQKKIGAAIGTPQGQQILKRLPYAVSYIGPQLLTTLVLVAKDCGLYQGRLGDQQAVLRFLDVATKGLL